MKKQFARKLLSVLICIVLLLTALPLSSLTASAADYTIDGYQFSFINDKGEQLYGNLKIYNPGSNKATNYTLTQYRPSVAVALWAGMNHVYFENEYGYYRQFTVNATVDDQNKNYLYTGAYLTNVPYTITVQYADGTPAAGRNVKMTLSTTPVSVQNETTDANGQCKIYASCYGDGTLGVYDGYKWIEQTVRPTEGGQHYLTVTLPNKRVSVPIQVMLAGEKVSNYKVTATSGSDTVTGTGSSSLNLIEGLTYNITVTHYEVVSGYISILYSNTYSGSATYTVPASPTTLTINAALNPPSLCYASGGIGAPDVYLNNGDSLTMTRNQSIELSIKWFTGFPDNSITYSYTSSNPDVLSVSGSTITANSVGEATLTVKATWKTTSAESKFYITVSKDSITIPAADTTTYTYNGKTQTYKIDQSTAYTISNNTRTAAGTQTVTVKLNDPAQTQWSDGTTADKTYTFTINKAPLTVTAKDKTITYGDAPANDGVSYSGFVNGETANVLGGTLTYGYNYARYGNVGTYTITPKGLTSDNYAITFTSGKLTVQQKEIGIAWGNASFTYDGNAHKPTATATGMVNNDVLGLTVSGEQTNASATAYTATVTAITGTKAGNYKLPQNVTTSFTIANASQTAPAVNSTNESIYGKADGKITGVTSAMEYCKKDESTYTPITGEAVTDLEPGTYYVRYAAKANHNASADTKVVIGAGRMLKVTVVNGDGYTITVDKTEFEYMGGFTITLTIAEGYSKTEQFDVLLNGSSMNWSEWAVNNEAQMTEISEDITITVVGVADVTAPEVEMSVKGVGWKQFINKVTFGLFFKENVEIKVEATDLGSKIKTAEYLFTETAFTTEDAVKNDTSVWTALTLKNGAAKINVTEKGKKYVYVRVTDNAGNITVVSSDGGVVVYTDSTADTTAISFIKTTTDDVTAKVNLNGNTVKAIYNGTDLVDSVNFSVAADGTITFKAAYLDTLAEGTYTLHIVYNPQGENYVESNINEAPAKTNITLNVGKQTGTVSITNDISKTYDGSAVTAPTYDRNNVSGTVVVEYKKKGADDNTYSTDAPKNAGDYTVCVTVKADDAGFYTEVVSAPVDFTIGKATLTVTAKNKTAKYGDAVPTYTEKYDGFANGEDKNVLGGTLNLVCDYAQFSDKGEYTIKASGYTSDNYTINYVDGKLTVSAKPITVTIQNATSIYGEALVELKATDNGIENGDTNVYSLATTVTSTSDVGKYAITGKVINSNYAITFANETDAYEITKREITITVEAKETIVNTALPTYTYTVSGLFGEDKLVTDPTLTSNADITVIGEYDIVATDADAGNNYSIKYVPAKLTVLTDNAVDAAKGYEEEIKDLDPNTVTSEDKAELGEIRDEINTILEDESITDNGKKALEEVKEQVENLIKEITDAAEATNTENTQKVEDVTAENVTPDNKTDLEGAKTDLAKALDEHGNNMTEDEKKAIEDEIKRIDDALEVIGNVEAVEELIDKLPENITKNDEAAIKAADDAYNALSDYEKKLVNESVKKKLDDAKAKLTELKSPSTGDNSNMFLMVALLFISGGLSVTLTVVDKKRKVVKR